MPRRLLIAAVAVVAVALIAVASGCGGGKADQVRFQNASDPGPKPFTEPTDVPKGSSTVSTSTSSSSSSSSSSGSSDSSSSGSSGGSGAQSGEEPTRGSFTTRNTVCDREKLISALAADEGKLKAWADALGIDSDQQAVAEYIRKLKPSTLTRDTQVTTHSYENGEAKEYQAILRKGTAVLVDDSGKPVARCVCGNPLTEPAELEQTTKCINCPRNYQPSDTGAGGPCDERCSRPEPNPPPVLPPTNPPLKPNTDPIAAAKDALDKCKKDKGGLDKCKTEYETTRKLCAADPFNKACDSSVCFNAIVDFSSDGCSSYIDQNDILGECLKREGDAKTDCLNKLRDLQKKCAATPTDKDCVGDPKIKAFRLRRLCLTNAGRPECRSVILDCIRNPQFGCDDLRVACNAKPDRPDCKAARDFRVACLTTPNLPECQGVALPTAGQQQQLQQEQQPDQQGEQGTGTEQPEQGGGTGDTGTGGTGGTGETPEQGGQQQTQPEQP